MSATPFPLPFLSEFSRSCEELAWGALSMGVLDGEWEPNLIKWFNARRPYKGPEPGGQWERCRSDPVGWALETENWGVLMKVMLSWAQRPEWAPSPPLSPEQARRVPLELASVGATGAREEARAGAMSAALRLGGDPDATGRERDRVLALSLKRSKRDRQTLRVARVVAERCDPSLPGNNGQGPLTLACSLPVSNSAVYGALPSDEHDALALCQQLAARGADVNEPGFRGMGPLHHAALAKNARLCCWLVEQGADLEAVCLYGRTPMRALLDAAPSPDDPALAAMRALVERGELLAMAPSGSQGGRARSSSL